MTTLGDLTPRHIGRRITVSTSDTTITGVLRAFNVHTEWISEPKMCQSEPDEIPGASTVTVEIGPWASRYLSAETEVEVL